MLKNTTLKQTVLPDNWIDKLYRYVAPIKAADRTRARMALALANSYVGASRKRQALSNYSTSCGDADRDLIYDLPQLRQRSRDLVRNNPLALGAMNTVCTNVVGTGLKLQARIDRDFLKLSDETADALESTIEREFKLWANSTGCDATRTLNFTGLQTLVFRSVLENGDCFVQLAYQDQHRNQNQTPQTSPYALCLQVIEADRVCNPHHQADSETLIAGVQKTSVGAPLAYHVLKNHPGSMNKKADEWIIALAFHPKTGLRQMLHLYTVLRPGQTRGVPYLAPVIEPLKQLGSYTEAEVMAAVVSSCLTVFVKSPQGDEVLSNQTNQTNQNNPSHQNAYQLGPGLVVNLADGEDITSMNPLRPNAQFDPFVQSILRQVGVALELPFEVLIKHFTASYSAARAALLEAWRFFMVKREWLAQSFCQVVYEQWLTEAVLRNRIQAPGFIEGDPAIRAAYCGTHWIGPAPGQIDPLKEIQAARERIDAGISTLSRETASLTGEEWEKTHRQWVKEERLRGATRSNNPHENQHLPEDNT